MACPDPGRARRLHQLGTGGGDPQDGQRQCTGQSPSWSAEAWRRSACRPVPLQKVRPEADGSLVGFDTAIAHHRPNFGFAAGAPYCRANLMTFLQKLCNDVAADKTRTTCDQ